MRTIAVINQKGGCGKTTTSINLAACLARLNQRTLLVDMDPQGHCGVGLAVPEEQIERTIYDALIEEQDGKVARVNELVWQIASDFDLAPANIRLAAFEQVFAGREGREDRLSKALESARQTYQWCVIDCPPSVGLLTFNALRACDEVIVPVETGFFSLHGLTKMMETLELLRERCGKETAIRILPTLYDTRTKLAREVLSELRGKFREYLMESTINFNTKLKEAASFGQPITEYDPGSRGYKDFVNLARELMGHRPVEVETAASERLSRPAELVKRAKQLAQVTNYQFGRNTVATGPAPIALTDDAAPAAEAAASAPVSQIPVEPAVAHEPVVGGRMGKLFGGVSEPAPAADAPDASDYASQPSSASEALALVDDDLQTAQDRALDKIEAELATGSSEAAAEPRPAKTTAQKLEEFYGVKQIGDEVVFSVRFQDAKKVLVSGDFNNWSPNSTPMLSRDGSPGEWWMSLPLAPGRYRYRFIVDGQWVTDPNNKYVESNQYGELNNIVEVE
jgi:chromosome partitioning protein